MEFHVLAARGEGGYRQYRIPAMAVTPSGRVLAVYDGRPDLDDLPGPIDLVLRTSDDNGRTWSPQTVLRASAGVAGFGDASIVIDPEVGPYGRILVFSQATQLAGFFESTVGTADDDPTVAHVDLSVSDDDGRTWTHRRITAQVKDARTPAIFATSGMGGRIAVGPYAGRLLQTFVLRRDGEVLACVGFSDDHGDTWQLGALIPGGNESAAVGLPDGSVLVHSRAYPHRLVGRSDDGGQTLTSLAPDVALVDPGDNGSLCVLASGAVVCTHNHDVDLRARTVAKRSTDGGRTWPETAVISAGSSAYSTACELADGAIGVLFERNGYAEMVFARIDAADFVPTATALVDAVDANGVECTVVLRYIRPVRLPLPADVDPAEFGMRIPPADTSVWEAFERKEVGQPGATSEPIYTRAEYDLLLGPITPGLHVGDELRFSGRLANHGAGTLTDVSVQAPAAAFSLEAAGIAPGERLAFGDVRLLVGADDVASGVVRVAFQWQAQLHLPDAPAAIGISGEWVQAYAIATGLPVLPA